MSKLEGNQLTSDYAAECADIMAILEDVSQAHDAARIYLSGKYAGDGDNMRTRKALYESALISLRRSLKNGASRLPGDGRQCWQIPREELQRLIGPDQELFEEALNLADKCVAHRVRLEAGNAQVVSGAPIGEPHVQLKFSERVVVVPAIHRVTLRIREYLMPLLVEKHKKAVEESERV